MKRINEIDWPAVREALPHGSGIDSKWSLDIGRDTVTMRNSYHGMDESGMYDGWLDFRIVFFRHRRDVLNPLKGAYAGKVQVLHARGDWDFRIVGRFSAVARRDWGYDLKGYLEESVQEYLSSSGFAYLCGQPHAELRDAAAGAA